VAVAPFLAMTLVAARGAATSYYVDPGNPTPCATLREAIQAAGSNAMVNTCPAGGANDTIVVKAGTYAFNGQESLGGGGTLTIQGETLNPADVTIDLGGGGRFLTMGGGGSYVLAGLTIKNGHATGSGAHGGVVRAVGVSLTMLQFRMESNVADWTGGAVYFYSDAVTPGTLTLEDGVFQSNQAKGMSSSYGAGGAVRVQLAGGQEVEMRDLTFAGNVVIGDDSQGGALNAYVTGAGSRASCVRCSFTGNSAGTATSSIDANGGAATVGADDHAAVSFVDVSFTGNSAVAGSSIGFVNFALSIFANNGATVELERLLVHGNLGTCPAILTPLCSDAYFHVDEGMTTWSVLDSEFTAGVARGIWASDLGESTFRFGHLTISGYPHGGLFWGSGPGTAVLQNSIVSGNGDWDTFLDPPTSATETTNLVGGTPLFVNAAGGNYRLQDISPAVDAGTVALVTARPFDRDHAPRVIGLSTDIGAYELGALFGDAFELGHGAWSHHSP